MKVEKLCYHYQVGNIYGVEGMGYFTMFAYSGGSIITELKPVDSFHVYFDDLADYGRFLKEAHKALKKYIKKTHPMHNDTVLNQLKESCES